MKLLWQIENTDIQKVKSFYESQKNKTFVKNRVKRNVNKNIPKITDDLFWKAMISCLLTTQQRSGPHSSVTKFIATKPFPLNYKLCKISKNLKITVEEKITSFGGLRRAKSIGDEVSCNYEWLQDGGWEIIHNLTQNLIDNPSLEIERESASIIIDKLKGFGPKQSRNLLQSLGITKYEIPIDSRITKWLNAFGFPIILSATALSDRNYYNFVSDGFQKICEACNIYPCVMDAAIFSSVDEDWPEENLVW